MSAIVFAGAAQFAAVGYVASGLAWPGIILLTALLNARHLLYSASLSSVAPPRALPSASGHGTSPDRRGVRPVDRRISGGSAAPTSAATGSRRSWPRSSRGTSPRWPASSSALRSRTRPSSGIDIIFPAAMIGLAVGLITGRARARGRHRRGRDRRGARAAVESGHRHRRRRRARPAGRAAGAGRGRPRDRAAREPRVGGPLRDARDASRCRDPDTASPEERLPAGSSTAEPQAPESEPPGGAGRRIT